MIFPPTSPLFARNGIAAASHPFVVEAALEIMRAGGNAIDAAIAGAAVMMAVDPCNGALGGDAFCLIHCADGSVHALNGSGAAPAGATLAYFGTAGFPAHGLCNATVPGEISLWLEANARFGTMPLKTLLARAIDYARQGVPVTWYLQKVLTEEAPVHGAYAATVEELLPNGGKPPEIGTIFRQPKLARGLERLAAGEGESFYRGDWAREMVAFSRANGGLFTLDDFANHTTEVGSPLCVAYRGRTVSAEAPVSPGIVLLLALKILDRFDMGSLEPQSPQRFHLLIESLKLAFDDHALLGDPRFVEVDLEGMLSDAHADEQAARLDLKHARLSHSPPPAQAAGTDHASFGDAGGNVVAYIHSTYHSCGLFMGESGVLMNSRLRAFSLDPASPNVLAPGKRPIHTLTSYLVHDASGNVVMAGGTPGGPRQPQWNLQTLTNVLDFGLPVTDAIRNPRFTLFEDTRAFVDRVPTVHLESFADPSLAGALAQLGHPVNIVDPWPRLGSIDPCVQAIVRDPQTGIYQGGTEIRRPLSTAGGY